jgi:hypothetical protein
MTTKTHFVLASFLLASSLLGACASESTSSDVSKDDVRAMGKADNGHDFCEELGWYSDGVCDDFCLRLDDDCASDARRPEMGDDLNVLRTSKVTMAQGLAEAGKLGPVIEAKFEIGGDGKLSLSTYPVGKSLAFDSERNVFQELAGDPTMSGPFSGALEPFHDLEHLTRSSRDLTLRQLSAISLEDAVSEVNWFADVYWAIPTVQEGRAGYGIWALVGDGNDAEGVYYFIDGQGSNARQTADLGAGPGSGASDARTPELGTNPSVARQSKVKMSAALRKLANSHKYGGFTEAKFELDDNGTLSLSIYPVKEALDVDAERQTFFELAGDPTLTTFAPTESTFAVPDEEHLTRAARDLTIVQTARMSLLDAVTKAESKFSGGFVYWAIPTVRGTRSGFGVYILDSNNMTHYLFIS